MTRLHLLRVFCAEDGSGGNPLGVFLDGAAVPPERRQAVAADLGLSDFDMGAIIDNLDLTSVEMLVDIADKIKLNPQFRKAVEAAVG